ncbi:DUF1573 domain-containing protein [Chryseobacterium echinoideorum]|uniref:DUF1573 domain-containing protein n=1 Tax=Chryseobacterium echinoideorum TaxID=1549648 RepID=UPI0011871BFB|nr:DUF1573 domain-containing protein [Chryseobacterium echinoideorum]
MNKTLKIILITLFAIFVIIIAVIKTLSNNKYSINITKNDGKIKIPVSEYNFGEISYRDSVGYDFKIMNVGETPVVLSKISQSCNCTSLEYKNNDIQPADFLTIKAKFKPKKEDIGRNKITIFLKGNFEQENYILSLEGNVTE